MNVKPLEFYIGIINFFSMILPEALIKYFLKGLLYANVFGIGKGFPLPETDVQKWIVFLFATYISGNIIFLIASLIIDKFVYDKYIRNIFFKRKNFDISYHMAIAICDQYLPFEFWGSQVGCILCTK